MNGTLWGWMMASVAALCSVALMGCSGCGTPESSGAVTGASAPPAYSFGAPSPLFEVSGLAGLRHRPLIAMFEWDPWNTVIGSDMPVIVVYEDGLVIQNSVLTDRGPRWSGLTSQMQPVQAQYLVDALATPEFLALPARMAYEGNDNVDLPTVDILVRRGEKWKRASVNGLRRDLPLTRHPQVATFQKVYLTLLSPDVPDGVRWVPDELEILLWGDDSKRKALPWPTNLPAPRRDWRPAKAYGRWTDEAGVNKYIIPGKYEDDARMFVRELGDSQSVLVNDFKVHMRVRRYTPGESYLREVIRAGSRAASNSTTQ